MAHAAKLGALTDELASLLTCTSAKVKLSLYSLSHALAGWVFPSYLSCALNTVRTT